MKRININVGPSSRKNAFDASDFALSTIYEKLTNIGIPKTDLYIGWVPYDYSIVTIDSEKAEKILQEINSVHGFTAKMGDDLPDTPVSLNWTGEDYHDLVLFNEGWGIATFKKIE